MLGLVGSQCEHAEKTERGEYHGRGPQGKVQGFLQVGVDQVAGKSTEQDRKPGGDATDMLRYQQAEQGAEAYIAGEVSRVRVQGQGGHCAPPLPVTNFPGIRQAGLVPVNAESSACM